MDVGAVFSPLLGTPVGSTHPFSDWMCAAEQVCTALARAGFRFVVFTHSYQYVEMQPLVTMARLAPATAPLRMATQVPLLPFLNAADVAYNVVTPDHICEGRLDLGIGLAYHLKEVELGGITRHDRVPKFEEALEVMKKFWTGEEVHHEGRYFTVYGTRMGVTPYQKPHWPLWIAAHSHGAAARAGCASTALSGWSGWKCWPTRSLPPARPSPVLGCSAERLAASMESRRSSRVCSRSLYRKD